MTIKSIFDHSKWPFLIAGPCSAETEEQMISIAGQLRGEINLFRAGVWKPRTRPNAFEGVGEKALAWLIRIKNELGIPVTTEVANAKHVELCLSAGIDVLWIGARTTVNPFSVQEIADALKGVKIPVMVKNPISPDLALWLGAIERLQLSGIEKIAAIHRGFSTMNQSTYRNKPQWEIALELKRYLPDIELIVDPSHICGNREHLGHVAQQALDLNYNGIMLETHNQPEKAWSDAKQQISPEQFLALINSLVLRNKSSKDSVYLEKLYELRDQIDQIDLDLIKSLADRMKVSEQIAILKKNENIAIFQEDRWNEVIEQALEEAKKYGLSQVFINRILRAIHEESINHQDTIMNLENQ